MPAVDHLRDLLRTDALIVKFDKLMGIKKEAVSRAYSKVVVVFGAFNAAGDIGPAIDILIFAFCAGYCYRPYAWS